MKILALVVFLTALLTGCAHATPDGTINLPGTWYAALRVNSTDYRLDDCVYSTNGTYSCKALDNGCAGTFCEAESYAYSGAWSLVGQQLTRQVGTGAPQRLDVKASDANVLLWSNGEHWFRSEKARSRFLKGAL
jgi:hypothetical protein